MQANEIDGSKRNMPYADASYSYMNYWSHAHDEKAKERVEIVRWKTCTKERGEIVSENPYLNALNIYMDYSRHANDELANEGGEIVSE